MAARLAKRLGLDEAGAEVLVGNSTTSGLSSTGMSETAGGKARRSRSPPS